MRFLLAFAVLAVVAVIGVTQALYALDQTQQAIITQFGVYRRTVDQPGLHTKVPFVETVNRLDRRILRFDADASEFLTKDKKALVVDAYARFRIADPLQFFITVRTEEAALARLQGVISSQLREEVASHDQIEIIKDNREALMRDVTAKSDKVAREDFGIDILDVRIGRADFPPEVASRVYERMKSERIRIANQYRAEGTEQGTRIRAEADKERTVLLAEADRKSSETRGEGEAEAIRIYADAINLEPEFYIFLRSLEAYRKALQQNTTVVLSAKSDLFQYLTSSAPPGAGQ